MAATTAATATVVPTRALRTWTAPRPCPGSNAIRTPMLPGTEPASPSAGPSRGRGTCCRSGPARARRGPGGRPQRRGHHHEQRRGGDDEEPGAEDGQVDLDPRAGLGGPGLPMGMSGEAAMAVPTATTAPAVVTTATLARDSTVSRDLPMPRVRRTGNSAESRMSWRL